MGIYALAHVVALLCFADLSDDERSRVAEYRRHQIAVVAKEIAGFEKDMKAAQKSRNKPKVDELKGKVAAARKQINELKQATDDELFGDMKDQEREGLAVAFREQQTRDRERELAAAGPVAIAGMGISTNQIGVAELIVELQNNTGRDVEAVEIAAECFNKFDEPVKGLDGDNLVGFHFKHSIPARSSKRASSQLVFQQSTAKANVWVSRVLISGGEVWTQTKAQAEKTPYGIARARLLD